MSNTSAFGLRKWIWRAFLQSALIPLLLVETVLIGTYLLTNSEIRDAQIGHLRETALGDLQTTARRESHIVGEQLVRIDALARLYTELTAKALSSPAAAAADNLALSAEGVRYSPEDLGGAAVFYSNATPAARQDLDKVARLSRLDPLMQQIQAQNPLVASIYFNSWDSLNHIYPWFNTREQYPHDMVIPDYNFYYLADAGRNPTRDVVWTDVYLDPAGHGWMMSAIAPVYRGDFLEGVTGLDITVSGLLSQIGQLQVPWNGYAMLVGKDLSIMAMPPAAEEDFGLDELTQHSYEEAIRRELFKPEDFNLHQQAATGDLAKVMARQPEGVERVFFNGRAHLVAWSTIAQTGWHLLTVVEEADVFAQTNSLASYYQQIGYLLIAGLALFYLLFFSFMWWRSLKLSRQLQRMIAGISAMMKEIGAGHWHPAHASMAIREFEEVAEHALSMGAQLEQSEQERSLTQQRLELVLDSATESLWEWNLAEQQMQLRGRLVNRLGVGDRFNDPAAFMQLIHPEDREQIEAVLAELDRGSRDDYQTKFRIRDASGQYHWLLSRGRVLARDPHTGVVSQLAGTHIDIDDLKRMEQSRELVSQELSHRIKNIFAVINGLIGMSARQSPLLRPLAEELQDRIAALGRAHEFARPHSEQSRPVSVASTLRGLLGEILSAYPALGEGRLTITGDDPDIDDRSATPIALVFHELATNSAKYGALSSDIGTVAIEVKQVGDDVQVNWIERHGPPLAGEPAETGFGTRLVQLAVTQQLAGGIERHWLPEGLRVDMRISASRLKRADGAPV